MATIQKRKNKNGITSYRVMIRPDDGLPTQYKTLPTYQEAKDWAIQEEAKRRQGPEATVNRHLASLSAVLSHGVKECEWILSNPMTRVKKLKEAEGRNRTLSPDECSRLLEACAKSSNKLLFPFVILALTTGARSGELLTLQWNAVDLENGLIHLKSTKNGRPRVLAVVRDVLEMLKELFSKRSMGKPWYLPAKPVLVS